tara:strand:- start:877 stop:1251 length:375 start_codon:yes stop_codon:yes gene_type:complete
MFSLQLKAQMNISTNLRQDGVYNEVSKEWEVISTDDEVLTFFEFNKDFTMFKHTTASITSAYMIKSSEEDKKREQWELDIVSDVGNKYVMIIDLKNDNVRFIYKNDDKMYMVHHTIKKVWFDEE